MNKRSNHNFLKEYKTFKLFNTIYEWHVPGDTNSRLGELLRILDINNKSRHSWADPRKHDNGFERSDPLITHLMIQYFSD